MSSAHSLVRVSLELFREDVAHCGGYALYALACYGVNGKRATVCLCGIIPYPCARCGGICKGGFCEQSKARLCSREAVYLGVFGAFRYARVKKLYYNVDGGFSPCARGTIV